jgi:hypothetical protein
MRSSPIIRVQLRVAGDRPVGLALIADQGERLPFGLRAERGGFFATSSKSEIKSECWATSSRIRGRLPSESAADSQFVPS